MVIGIVGYGRLGRAVEIEALYRDEITVAGVFTRRKGGIMTLGAPVCSLGSIDDFSGRIDCMLVCHGSSSDAPSTVQRLARSFNTVDAFDIHSEIAAYRARVDTAAKDGNTTAILATGWDPGLLSLIRLYSRAFMPRGVINTFWGEGVSQGHTEAIKSVSGVIDAIELTVPRRDAVAYATAGQRLSDTERHRRVCYVVCEPEDEDRIRCEIVSMEGYFRGYETEVHFVTLGELLEMQKSIHHSGRVISVAMGGLYREQRSEINFSLSLDSNPDFTASVMLTAARAAVKMKKEGMHGAYTLLDIPPSFLLGEKSDIYDYI